MNFLICVEGAQKGQRYPLEADSLTIGRDRNNNIPVNDPIASRLHATIYRKGEELYLRDEKSTNGTFVNAKRVSTCRLHHGDRISIGDTVFLVEWKTEEKPTSVTVSDAMHDTSSDISLNLASTSLVSVAELIAVQERVNEQFLALLDFIAHITGTLDLDLLLPQALEKIAQVLHADRGAILFLDKNEKLTPQAVWPADAKDILISRTITEAAREGGGILSTPSAASFRNTASIAGQDVGSVVCAPLKAEAKTFGVIYLYTRLTSPVFTETTLRLATAMAMHLAVTIQNANLYRSLRNAEEFSSCILKSLNSGILVVDEKGTIIRTNDAVSTILGIEPHALVGHPMASVPEVRAFAAAVAETQATGIPRERAEVVVRIGEREIPLGFSTSVLEDYTGRSIGVLCHFQDLTRLKKLGEEVKRSQRLASLGEMAAGIAHEVRNPLNSIRGFTQLLQEAARKRGDAEGVEYTTIVIEEVDRINAIVQDLLDFSRQRELSMFSLNLKELVESVVRQVQGEAAEAGVSVTMGASPSSMVSVMGNADKLRQLLLNLIRNAIQACAEGGHVELSLDIAPHPSKVYREALVRVRDDGVGIPPDVIEKIFDPFFTTKDVGTGLGLAICQKIAEQHAGRIEVTSTLGLGSTFTLAIPLRE